MRHVRISKQVRVRGKYRRYVREQGNMQTTDRRRWWRYGSEQEVSRLAETVVNRYGRERKGRQVQRTQGVGRRGEGRSRVSRMRGQNKG